MGAKFAASPREPCLWWRENTGARYTVQWSAASLCAWSIKVSAVSVVTLLCLVVSIFKCILRMICLSRGVCSVVAKSAEHAFITDVKNGPKLLPLEQFRRKLFRTQVRICHESHYQEDWMLKVCALIFGACVDAGCSWFDNSGDGFCAVIRHIVRCVIGAVASA